MNSTTFALCLIVAVGIGATPVFSRVVIHELPEAVQPLAQLQPETSAQPPPASTAEPALPPPKSSKPRQKKSRYWATTWVDRADNTYAFDEKVVFYIKAKRDAYITLLDVGTSGKVHVIFPNRHQPSNFVRAGQIIRIPAGDRFAIRAAPPAGTELVKLIATLRPHALFDPVDLTAGERFATLSQNPRTLAKTLKTILNQRHAGRWSTYAKVIKIVPPQPKP